MRIILLLILLTFGLQCLRAQSLKYDSLKNLLASAKDDSTKYTMAGNLAGAYIWSYPDSSLKYLQQAIILAKQMKSEQFLRRAYSGYIWFYIIMGDYPQALQFAQESLRLAEKSKNQLAIAHVYDLMELIYEDQGDYQRALAYENMARSSMELHLSKSLHKANDDTAIFYISIFNGFASVYEKLNQLDLALKYIRIVDDAYLRANGKRWSAASFGFGNIYLKMGNYSTALQHYRMGISLAIDVDNKKDLMDNYNGMANTFKQTSDYDSSIFCANKVLEISKTARHFIAQFKALTLLSDVYKAQKKVDSVEKYLQLAIAAKDSLFSQQKVMQIQNMTFNEQLREQEETEQQRQWQTKIKFYSLLTVLIAFLLIASLLYRNNLHKQKAYTLLQKQKHETDAQKVKTEQTLEELKSTQAQLIQSEKMASLGELTAGIAHEIQNPLNFVNNFSDVNTELVDELTSELAVGNTQSAIKIAGDIKENEQKINHHGKRADSIVKGMLEHSRASTGKKELTDINKIADEYLRLAYYGLRAKDKEFRADIETDFDERIGKISIIPQDIGRVLLNLYSNAFYAVNEKFKARLSQLTTDYKPLVSVQTKRINSKVEITVSDNGNGIPKKVLDKIFQPFFTTKPTGEGTGLGLSLAYDIVKAHGGEIKVETKEGEGSEFMITLLANS